MEESLTGGNMDPVVRIGATVRRTAGAWTPAVHTLLDTLASAGISEVPQAIGWDDRGREVLSYIGGQTLTEIPAGEQWDESFLLAAGSLLRRIHDASVDLVRDEGLVWRSPRRNPPEVICHNDFATYNLIVRDGDLVGAIDFDFASPGSRVWDLAYLAYRIVPFAEDAQGAADLDQDRRLALLVAAYGMSFERRALLRVAVERLDDLAAFTRRRADETGRRDFLDHAAMYERDAARLRQLSSSTSG